MIIHEDESMKSPKSIIKIAKEEEAAYIILLSYKPHVRINMIMSSHATLRLALNPAISYK